MEKKQKTSIYGISGVPEILSLERKRGRERRAEKNWGRKSNVMLGPASGRARKSGRTKSHFDVDRV